MKLFILGFFILIAASAHSAPFTTSYQGGGTATTTSTKVLDAKQDRAYLLILNMGVGDIVVKPAAVQSANEGLTVFGGGAWEPQNVPRDAIYLKTLSGTEPYYIIEGSL